MLLFTHKICARSAIVFSWLLAWKQTKMKIPILHPAGSSNRCVCNAAVWNRSQCGSRWPRISSKNVGYAQANGKVCWFHYANSAQYLSHGALVCKSTLVGQYRDKQSKKKILAWTLSCRTCLCCRPEMVVGWYHSHPGFGCWLSGVDINTQQSFEALSERAVAVVVDPIQSVKGKVSVAEPFSAGGMRWIELFLTRLKLAKSFCCNSLLNCFVIIWLFYGQVVIDAFRLINPNMMVLGHEPRQTTSNLGHLQKPSIQVYNS